jgi:hypothetical protein
VRPFLNTSAFGVFPDGPLYRKFAEVEGRASAASGPQPIPEVMQRLKEALNSEDDQAIKVSAALADAAVPRALLCAP